MSQKTGQHAASPGQESMDNNITFVCGDSAKRATAFERSKASPFNVTCSTPKDQKAASLTHAEMCTTRFVILRSPLCSMCIFKGDGATPCQSVFDQKQLQPKTVR